MFITDKKITKVLKHTMPPEKIWWYWTTHEGLNKFFGVENKLTLKPDGAFEIYFLMDNDYGLRGSENCKVLSYIPNKMFSFTWNAPPQFEEIRNGDHKTWVVLDFEEKQMTLTHYGWPEGEDWEDVMAYFENAWDIVLENLQKAEEI